MNRRSFDVFFNCELIGKTHPTPKKIKGRMKWRFEVFSKSGVDRCWSLLLFASDCSVSLLGLNAQELRGEHSMCIEFSRNPRITAGEQSSKPCFFAVYGGLYYQVIL